VKIDVEIRNRYLLNANADLYRYTYQLSEKEEEEEGWRKKEEELTSCPNNSHPCFWNFCPNNSHPCLCECRGHCITANCSDGWIFFVLIFFVTFVTTVGSKLMYALLILAVFNSRADNIPKLRN
jgi:hypothetical protein